MAMTLAHVTCAYPVCVLGQDHKFAVPDLSSKGGFCVNMDLWNAADREQCTVKEVDLRETLIQDPNVPGEYRISTNGEDYATVSKRSM